MLKSDFCMLCSEAFKLTRLVAKYNCEHCGKMVCGNCSRQNRRLSKLDGKKYRVCDECDAILANHQLQKMFQREIINKKASYEEARQRVKDLDRYIMHAEVELK